MRVNIDEIKNGGIECSWDLTRDEVDAAVAGDPAGYRASGPMRVEARLEKAGRRVFVAAHASAEFSCPCGRCLTPTIHAVPVDFRITLVPSEERGQGGEMEQAEVRDDGVAPSNSSFAAAEVDEEIYSGREIDLDPIVREQLLLELPTYPVCAESCKGLCPLCGKNLNDRDCGCDRRVPDPRWAALRDLKLKQ